MARITRNDMEKHDQIFYCYLITSGHVTYSVTQNERLLYLGQKSNLSIFYFNIQYLIETGGFSGFETYRG